MEPRAASAHVSTISAHNFKSCWLPVASYALKQVKAVPRTPEYTLGSKLLPEPGHPFHDNCTT